MSYAVSKFRLIRMKDQMSTCPHVEGTPRKFENNQGVKIHRVFACIMYNTVFVFIIVLYINIVVEFYM